MAHWSFERDNSVIYLDSDGVGDVHTEDARSSILCVTVSKQLPMTGFAKGENKGELSIYHCNQVHFIGDDDIKQHQIKY